MLDHIFSTIELLGRHPGLGRGGRVPGTRELVLRPLPFIVVYRVRRSRIEVIALLHGARKWPSGF
jgi:toxin ParE1/3/4